ncbi:MULTISPECIES: 6-phosphofructokinase [Crocosphaera]|nr:MULTISPECIES: 6-phosphofructokinase [Crocosphaera]CCQ49640.1 6-phosphofructokinase [Crocosphaera watsonii WH 8502]CCQ54039.1 6-phosphofructokinase [Crocosphaera watsonii WH 0005]
MGGTILGTTNKGDPFAFPMNDGTVRDRSSEPTFFLITCDKIS